MKIKHYKLYSFQTSIKHSKYRVMHTGENVEFQIRQSSTGRAEAYNVTGPGGAECSGSVLAKVARKHRCYNCGQFTGHFSRDCPRPRASPECYRCRRYSLRKYVWWSKGGCTLYYRYCIMLFELLSCYRSTSHRRADCPELSSANVSISSFVKSVSENQCISCTIRFFRFQLQNSAEFNPSDSGIGLDTSTDAANMDCELDSRRIGSDGAHFEMVPTTGEI